MASVELLVKGAARLKSVKVRALVSETHKRTEISRRLAQSLGLKLFHKGQGSPPITEYPMTIVPNFEDKRVMSVIPVVNFNYRSGPGTGSFWDMIIGQDCIQQAPDVVRIGKENEAIGLKPDPGPMFKTLKERSNKDEKGKSTTFTFESVKPCLPEHLIPGLDVFFEYPCKGSSAVFRMAANKATKQLAVEFQGNSAIYLYKNVPENIVEAIESGASRGQIANQVMGLNLETEKVGSFPETVALVPENKPETSTSSSEAATNPTASD